VKCIENRLVEFNYKFKQNMQQPPYTFPRPPPGVQLPPGYPMPPPPGYNMMSIPNSVPQNPLGMPIPPPPAPVFNPMQAAAMPPPPRPPLGVVSGKFNHSSLQVYIPILR
jgi:hypothetical protein